MIVKEMSELLNIPVSKLDYSEKKMKKLLILQ